MLYSCITACSFGSFQRNLKANAALMYDGMLVIEKAFSNLLRVNPNALRESAQSLRKLSCDSAGIDFLKSVQPFDYGRFINKYIREVWSLERAFTIFLYIAFMYRSGGLDPFASTLYNSCNINNT